MPKLNGWRSRYDWAVALVFVVAVLAPAMRARPDAGPDFYNHRWLIGYQAEAIRNTGLPTFFLHTKQDVFEPFFAFYGGTLYAAGGYFSVATGLSPAVTIVVFTGAALLLAYISVLVIGHVLGLRGWIAHIPCVTLVTAAYLLSDLYPRGAWTEVMALCGLTAVSGAVVAAFATSAFGARNVAALSASSALFSGAHNITLMWGLIVFGSLGVLLTIFVVPRYPWRRWLAVVGGLVAGACINAWFLVPDLFLSSKTRAGHASGSLLASFFDSPRYVLNPLRVTPHQSTTQGLVVAAPVLALVWAVVTAAGGWQHWPRRIRRAWAVTVTVLTIVFIVILCPTITHHLGHLLSEIQFAYRLNGYVLLLAAALVLLSLVRRPRPLVLGAIVVICLISIGQSQWQIWHVEKRPEVRSWLAHALRNVDDYTSKPGTWYDGGLYADASSRVVRPDATRSVNIPPAPPGTDRQHVDVTIPAGSGPVQLNVEAGPYLVAINGAQRIGINPAGRAVIAWPTTQHAQVARLTLTEARTPLIRSGEWLTVVGLLLTAAWIVGLAATRRVKGK